MPDETAPSTPPLEPIRVAVPLPDPTIALDDFCVHFTAAYEAETVGAFRFRERLAGRLDDTIDAYSARLAALCSTPLG
jgi:hypothetical protein